MSEWQETEFGKVPATWNIVRAEDFCIRVTDGTHDSPKRKNEGYYLVTSKHIKGRNIDFENAYLISKDDFDKVNQRSKVDQWDVIISMIGAYCGFCYIERNRNIDYAIKNVGLFKVGSKTKAFWLYYYFNSRIGKYFIDVSKSGTSQPYLSLGVLRDFPVIVPSDEEEQKAIAAVLSSLDDKIDLLRRQNATLEAMAQTLFRQWFVEEARDDWEEYQVRDFVTHHKQSVTPAKQPDEIFHHFSIPAFDESRTPVKELGSEIKSNKYEVLPFSVLVSKLNPRFPRIWDVYFTPEENSICSTEFQVFKPNSKDYFGFIYYLFTSNEVKNQLVMAASGTSGSHQRVRPNVMLDVAFDLPDTEKIIKFSKLVEPNLLKKMSNQKQIRTLEKLRDTLLPKLMSGEVRVRF